MAVAPGNVILGTTVFADMGLQAGGFLASIDIAPDGARVVGADANNAYYWGPSDDRGRALFTVDSLLAMEFDEADPDYEPVGADKSDTLGSTAVLSPFDSAYVGAIWRGRFYFSKDAGFTMRRGNLAGNDGVRRQFFNTGHQRKWNCRMKASPVNKEHALLGSTNEGVYKTKDWGDTITQISGIPATTQYGGTESPYLLDFGPDGKAYIMVSGTGLYSAANIDGSFSLMSGSPDWASHLYVAPSGNIYICDPDYSGLRKFNGSTWSNIPLTVTPWTVATNPHDENHIVITDPDGKLQQSYDGGTNWTETFFANYPGEGARVVEQGSDIAWVAGYPQFPACIKFSPTPANELWMVTGVSPTFSHPPLTYTSWPWYARGAGIRELVINNFLSVPGHEVLAHTWDQGTWKPGIDPGNLRAKPKFPPALGFDHHWQSDYASDDLDYIACAAGQYLDRSWYSEDGGDTLHYLFGEGGALPSGEAGGNGGAFAMSKRAGQIIVPGANQQAVYTKNEWGGPGKLVKVQGVDWDYVPIPIRIVNDYIRRNCVSADKTRDGVFVAVVSGSFPSQHGIHVTLNGGQTWAKKFAGQIDGDPTDYYSCTIDYIPGRTGEFLYTAGPNFNSRLLHFIDDANDGVRRYLGEAWGLTKVEKFCFGKALEGQAYPTIFFMGTVEGVSGLYRSVDFFATKPVLIDRYPSRIIDGVQALGGDWNHFGRCYVGGYGTGAVWGDFGDTVTGA